MIAKHVPIRSLRKSDFAGLVNYITDTQDRSERLGQVNINNCAAGIPLAVAAEVLATQQQNTRAKGDKTYHLLVSFRSGEMPMEEDLAGIEERLCVGLGFAEHQRISAVHHDTDNLHIHIAINKIHPTRLTLHEPYQAYPALAELCEQLEKDHQLEKDNHQPRKTTGEGRAQDMERHTGTESLMTWARRKCLAEIKAAESWNAVHQIVKSHGLELRKRGNGLVLVSEDGTVVKASTIARDLSKPNLEQRLGLFQPSVETTSQSAVDQYQKKPKGFRISTAELYAQYQDEQKASGYSQQQEIQGLKNEKSWQIKDALQANRLRCSMIKMMGGDRLIKKLLYAQAHQALKRRLQKINQKNQRERQILFEKNPTQSWADWLKKQALDGRPEALKTLRSREATQGLSGDMLKGFGNRASGGTNIVVDNITKKGTMIWRVGKHAIRDDGEKIQVPNRAANDAITAALQVVIERYGHVITIDGSEQFKSQVLETAINAKMPIQFADKILEKHRQEKVRTGFSSTDTVLNFSNEQIEAAHQYIAERESKRQRGMDIPKHKLYQQQQVPLSYMGIRQIKGQFLSLLKCRDEILIFPVDSGIARRLKRLRTGDSVIVTEQGSLQKKTGRQR